LNCGISQLSHLFEEFTRGAPKVLEQIGASQPVKTKEGQSLMQVDSYVEKTELTKATAPSWILTKFDSRFAVYLMLYSQIKSLAQPRSLTNNQ
jgi:hypothetical protein